MSLRDLLDYGGYKDIRYTCLSVGLFVFNLGIYAPYYYIGKSMPVVFTPT